MSKPTPHYTHVNVDDFEIKAGGDFYETELDSYPVNVKIRLSIHKSQRDNTLIHEMLKRSFKIFSVNLSDPDKPEIIFQEVGPLNPTPRPLA